MNFILQRGNKSVASKNFASKQRKALRKRQPKSNLFPELAASQSLVEKKVVAIGPAVAGSSVLHPSLVAKCAAGGLSSTAIGKLKKQQRLQPGKKQAKKLALLKSKKMFGSVKLEKDLWPARGGESSEQRNASKRKIEKKLSPTGNAGTSVRPPNKKRKKSKII